MDSRKFDELTKILATNTSRRQALKTILASVVGGALGLSGINAALAEPGCFSGYRACRQNRDCCSNRCVKGICSNLNCFGLNHKCRQNRECCSTHCVKGICRK